MLITIHKINCYFRRNNIFKINIYYIHHTTHTTTPPHIIHHYNSLTPHGCMVSHSSCLQLNKGKWKSLKLELLRGYECRCLFTGFVPGRKDNFGKFIFLTKSICKMLMFSSPAEIYNFPQRVALIHQKTFHCIVGFLRTVANIFFYGSFSTKKCTLYLKKFNFVFVS